MQRRLLLVCVLVSACTPVLSQTLVAGRCAQAPVIDAQMTDACWQEAMVATDFSVLSSAGGECAFRQTTVRAAWDDQALYLHIICLEPDPASITADVKDRDGSVWLEDAVEVFLQPDATGPDYLHFVVNPRGVLYDERTTNPAFNTQPQLRTETLPQAWQVEMALPWEQLGTKPPREGSQWGFNVGREHRPREPKEWSTWAPLAKGVNRFGLPELFGRLQFAAAPQAGRVSGYKAADGLVTNPDFSRITKGKPEGWGLSKGSTFVEVSPGAKHWAIRNGSDYGTASQPLNIPVKEGDAFTIYAIVRGSVDTLAGIAVVQEMQDGSPDDLYPFWRMEVGGDYRLYSGRIVADKGAKRLQAFNLYRANREGWVEYAYVQMYPGLRGLAGIVDTTRCTKPEHRGLGDPWPTPALASFKPLPGGPLRALIFAGEFQRDAVELAQRLDLKYDLVYCPTYRSSNKVEAVVGDDSEGILRRLAAAEYDVVLLAGKPSDPQVVDSLLGAVKAGVGLISLEPLAGGDPARPDQYKRLKAVLPTEELPAERIAELFGAFAPTCVASTSEGQPALKSVAVGQLEKGRVALLTWSESLSGLIPFAPGTAEYWEYRWAALSKVALWAANRKSPAQVASLVAGKTTSLQVVGTAAKPLTAEVAWDSALGVLGTQKRSVTLDAQGRATVTLDAPVAATKTRGPIVVRALLRDPEGHALDFATHEMSSPVPPVSVRGLAAPTELAPEAKFEVKATCLCMAGAKPTLRAELVDAFGRVVSQAEATPQAPGTQEIALPLQVASPLSVYHRVVVSAFDDGMLVDRVTSDLLVPLAAEDDLDDFALAVGYAAVQVRCPEYLRDQIAEFFRAHGVRSCTVSEYLVKRGLSAFGGVTSAGMRNSGTDNVRVRCFSDPAQLKVLADRVVAGVAAKRAWGFFGYNMDDETHLSQQGNEEFCRCDFCRRGFQQWARTCYGTIEAANREWGTDYKTLDDITVPLLKDLQGQTNPARWVDFRLHMDRVWANAYATAHDAVRAKYPDVKLSFTNPYCYNSLSGTDFSLWVPKEEVLLRYFHRHVVDRNKSWSQAPMISWFGYESSSLECGRFLWWFAFNGGVIPIWWDPLEPWAYAGKEGYTPWQMLDPLWRPTPRSVAVTGAADDLQRGIGRLLRLARPAAAEALVVDSQASRHALYAEPAMKIGRPTSDGYNRYQASDDTLASALKRAGLSYAYALADQLTAERLQGISLVVLPSCVALSDESAEALKAFVARGGKLLADVMPATRTSHGAPRPVSPLAEVFQGPQAICLGAQATSDQAATVDAAITRLGIKAALSWSLADGGLPVRTEAYRYTLGKAEYVGLVGPETKTATSEPDVILRLPERRFVYDARSGKLLGNLDQVKLAVPAGDARFLALLPYRVEGIDLKCEVQGLQLRVLADVRCGTQPTDHVLHLELTPPGQLKPEAAYTQNLLAAAGHLDTALPLALNDPRGEWKVTLRDVATGTTATGSFRLQ
ncbi:MAG: sugar-binding protein [Armatimonadia bacterium]